MKMLTMSLTQSLRISAKLDKEVVGMVNDDDFGDLISNLGVQPIKPLLHF